MGKGNYIEKERDLGADLHSSVPHYVICPIPARVPPSSVSFWFWILCLSNIARSQSRKAQDICLMQAAFQL